MGWTPGQLFMARKTKTRDQAVVQSDVCLACGAEILGPYCHVCGQKNDDCRRSIARLAGETVANVAALDGKFVRTVHSSLLRPGKHLHQYAHGKRSPFTPPVRFFFVVTFAFFATLWLTDRNIFILQLVPEDPDEAEVVERKLDFNIGVEADDMDEEAPGEMETEPETAAAADAAPTPPQGNFRIVDEISSEIVEDVRGEVTAALEEEGVDVPEILRPTSDPEPEPEVPVADDPPMEERVEEPVEENATADADPSPAMEEDEIEEEAEEPGPRIVPYGGFFLKAQDLTYTEDEKEWLRGRVQIGEGVTFLGRELTSERVADALIMTMQNPNAFNNALNESIPVLMLLFVPLMALLGAMFIRGQDALIYDHLLLSFQTHAFAYVILTLIVWTGFLVPAGIAVLIFALGMPLYYTLGLKGAFHRGWFHSVITTIFVGFVYLTLFVVALTGAVVFSIWQIV